MYSNVGSSPTNSQLSSMYPDSPLSQAAKEYESDYAMDQKVQAQANQPTPVVEKNNPNPPTADPATLKPGSPQAAEVDAHTSAVVANGVQNQALDQQATALQVKQAAGQSTPDDDMRLEAIQAQQAQNKAAAPDPTATNIVSPDASDVGTATAKQNFAATTAATLPVPQADNVGEVRHVTVDQMDLLTYINLTQFINPWGRSRQCDEDLKNLLSFVNQDYNSEVGEWTEVGKRIAETGSD